MYLMFRQHKNIIILIENSSYFETKGSSKDKKAIHDVLKCMSQMQLLCISNGILQVHVFLSNYV